MMRVEEKVLFTGEATFRSIKIPPNAGFPATAVVHQHNLHYVQPDGTDVAAAALVPVHTVDADAVLIGVNVVCMDAPVGDPGEETFTVDVLKANVSGGPATLLDAVVTYPLDAVDYQVEPGVIGATPELLAGDTVLVTVALIGSGGVQGQGLIVTVILREDSE